MTKQPVTPRKQEKAPMAAAALVLAVAMGSAVVWVVFAAATPAFEHAGSEHLWPDLHTIPNR